MEKRIRRLNNPIQIYAIERLRKDKSFAPAEGSEIVEYVMDGNVISAHTSYYRHLITGDNIHIRASEHGTSLNRWLHNNPQNALQNVSIVFSESIPTAGTNLTASTNIFFIVEQYYYILRSINKSDVDRIIEQIKQIQSTSEAEKVFIDPFKQNPKKKAGVQILRPYKDDKPIEPTTKVNQRQLDILNGKIKLDEKDIYDMVCECLVRIKGMREN